MNFDLLQSSLYKNDIERITSKFDYSLFNNKKFLITGGLGLICSAVVDSLIYLKLYKKIVLSIVIADINDELFAKKYCKYDFVEFMHYDALLPLSSDIAFDFILIGAGVASPNLYIKKPVETMLSNINGVNNLLNKCINKKVSKIIYISSSEIYGHISAALPFEENNYGVVDLDSIRSSYAVAKQSCELLCKSYSLEYDLPICIARPGHVFGPSASPNDKRVSSEFCFKALRGEKLILNSEGSQIRSYCYSIDCALSILIIFNHGTKLESYNIGSNEQVSIKEMCQMISDFANVEFEVLKNPDSLVSNPMQNSCLNINKIQKLGFSNQFSCKEGIEHTIRILSEVYR